jgi:HTH-type transcriptional regulator/antitoxin HipB
MNQIARTPKQLGAIIQRRRRAKGISQTEAAERAGLRQEMVSKIEGGSPGTQIRSVCDLMAALDLELTVAARSQGSELDIEDMF